MHVYLSHKIEFITDFVRYLYEAFVEKKSEVIQTNKAIGTNNKLYTIYTYKFCFIFRHILFFFYKTILKK